MAAACHVGIDLGTSGCRAAAVDRLGNGLAEVSVPLAPPRRPAPGHSEQDPELWWQAVLTVLHELRARLPDRPFAAIAVDGTSSTLLLCDESGRPLGPALMYDDTRSRDEARRIDRVAPPASPARGPGSSLAKALHLRDALRPSGGYRALHQADWIIGRLSGVFGVSDWNNALKLGFDPLTERWEPWLADLGIEPAVLPRVLAPGEPVGSLRPDLGEGLHLPGGTRVCAGTTDSTAAVIAAGAAEEGDAVTSLGTTLVLKILCPGPIAAPEHGVYSHRLGGLWLAGGASNSGGGVLRAFFADPEIRALSREIQPERPTGLDYYPLPRPGERFPIADPDLPPRMAPRPAEDRLFLQGLLEGIARIEAQGYALLQRLGAPSPRRVLTIGGGAANEAWTGIRRRLLGVPLVAARHPEAAYGAAILALRGPRGVFRPGGS